MDIALLVARIVLSAVFLVAGLTKLADLPGSRQAMRDFGLPQRLATQFGALLPLAELAVAIALIPTASAALGAAGALVLLLLFVGGIGFNLARGRQPDCHCFGQLHSSPAGWRTMARNAALAAVAAFVLVAGRDNPGPSAIAGIGDLSIAERVGLVGGLFVLSLHAVEGWAILQLLGQNGRMLTRLDAFEAALSEGNTTSAPAAMEDSADSGPGLPIGTPAPAFSLPGLYGETLTLDALRAARKPVFLIFSDPACGPCNALLPDLGQWQREHDERLTFALISRGTPEANRAKSIEHGVTHVLLQRDREVAEAYQANGTPIAVVVDPEGTIGSPLAPGAEAIRALLAKTVGTGAKAEVPPTVPAPDAPPVAANGSGPQRTGTETVPRIPTVGDRAPVLSFPDLEGRPTSIANFRGHRTLVLFWNPACGFCSQMIDELKAWEQKPPTGAPKLMVISAGTEEANRSMGIHAPIVLDQSFETGHAFGASGTPSAVLVDGAGKVASPVVEGADAVLALANGQDPSQAVMASHNGTGAPPRPQVGDPAPPVTLPDLNGKTVDLKTYRGTRTMLLFWNPGCGFCQRMLDDLKAWEAKRPKGAPRLVVISTGTPEANRAMGLRAPMLLDSGFSIGNAFGASGTPSAIIVDAKGNVASDVAVGASAVLALAGAPQDQPVVP
jgi:peroxiredoxin/uncharacterized membrane protein YphA (DoxX/SURF4 family)